MDDFTISLPVSEEFDTGSELIKVTKESGFELRRPLQTFAYYFKREFKCDFIQYEADEHKHCDNKYEGFLFSKFALDRVEEDRDTPHRLVGGGCFRWREWSNHEPTWELDWIWLHPFFRHRGIMSKHWSYFKQQYGNFGVTSPLSADMEKFLAKHT